jgi:hypothetical protein
MIEHADGTITLTSEEFFASAGLNEQLAKPGTSGQQRCARIQSWNGTAAEVEWGIYPQIVIPKHPAPGIMIEPKGIPVDHTLVLGAERGPRPARGSSFAPAVPRHGRPSSQECRFA